MNTLSYITYLYHRILALSLNEELFAFDIPVVKVAPLLLFFLYIFGDHPLSVLSAVVLQRLELFHLTSRLSWIKFALFHQVVSTCYLLPLFRTGNSAKSMMSKRPDELRIATCGRAIGSNGNAVALFCNSQKMLYLPWHWYQLCGLCFKSITI